MEYLMTYGWAILIISVVMAALFSLPILNGGAFGTSCLPTAGFYCSGITYPHVSSVTNALLIVTVGQDTGTNWQGAVFAYAPSGLASTSGGIPITPNTVVTASAPLASGGSTTLNLNVLTTGGALVTNVLVGTTTTGAIWACYSTTTSIASNTFNSLSGCNYIQVATITAKAT
jgi:hypothetical protein